MNISDHMKRKLAEQRSQRARGSDAGTKLPSKADFPPRRDASNSRSSGRPRIAIRGATKPKSDVGKMLLIGLSIIALAGAIFALTRQQGTQAQSPSASSYGSSSTEGKSTSTPINATQIKVAQETADLLKHLRKLKSAFSSGISFIEYSKQFGDLKFEASEWLRSADSKQFPALHEKIFAAIRDADTLRAVWKTSIEEPQIYLNGEFGKSLISEYPKLNGDAMQGKGAVVYMPPGTHDPPVIDLKTCVPIIFNSVADKIEAACSMEDSPK